MVTSPHRSHPGGEKLRFEKSSRRTSSPSGDFLQLQSFSFTLCKKTNSSTNQPSCEGSLSTELLHMSITFLSPKQLFPKARWQLRLYRCLLSQHVDVKQDATCHKEVRAPNNSHFSVLKKLIGSCSDMKLWESKSN